MNILGIDNWLEIWYTITQNKLRSILTGFGVFWGMSMLIILIGLGNSFSDGLINSLNGSPQNSCFFWTEEFNALENGLSKTWTFNNRDINLIKEKAYTIDIIAPVLFGGSQENNTARGRLSATYDIKGVFPEQFVIEPLRIMKGRVINEIDIKYNRKVCVIGKSVYETLFTRNENPIGQYIRIKSIYYKIIGVVSSSSRINIGGYVSNSIFLPLTTMQYTFSQTETIHSFGCVAKRGYSTAIAVQEVKTIIMLSHKIALTDEKAIGSINMERQYKKFSNLFYGVNILIWFVGLGTLFSGIIGISNIMLITIRKRTREIGIKRAIGASPRIIISQILSESFILTTIAGLGGVLFGGVMLWFIRYLMLDGVNDEIMFVPPSVAIETILVSLLILMLSGLLSGLIPAIRAIRFRVVDAIKEME